MKNLNENYIEKVEASLEELGVSADLLDLAGEYLDGKLIEEEFLLKLPKIDFNKKSRDEIEKTVRAYNTLKKAEMMNEYFLKYVDLIFQIGDATAGKIIQIDSYSYSNAMLEQLIERGVAKYKAAAMFTEGFVWQAYQIKWDRTKVLYQMGVEDLSILEKAISHCVSKSANAKTMLSSIYFMVKIEQMEEKGEAVCVDSLTANEKEQLKELVEDCIIESISNVTSTELTKEQTEVILDYTRKDIDGTMEYSNEVRTIISSPSSGTYLIHLLTSCSYLCHKLSYQLISFMKIMAFMDENTALSAIYSSVSPKKIEEVLYNLDTLLKIPTKDYLLWYMERGIQNKHTFLLHMYETHKSAFLKAAEECSLKNSAEMLAIVKKHGDGSEMEKIQNFMNSMQNRLVKGFTEGYKVYGSQIYNYLMGIDSLPELLTNMEHILKERYFYYYNMYEMVKSYVEIQEKDEFYERVIIYSALIKSNMTFSGGLFCFNKELGKYEQNSIDAVFAIFDKHQLPLSYQLNFIENMFTIYNDQHKKALESQLLVSLENMFKDRKGEVLEILPRAGALARSMILKALYEYDSKNIDILLDNFGDTSKLVRETLTEIVSKHEDLANDVLEKLKSKKQGERETAINIIDTWKKEDYKEALEVALEVEKSKKIISLLQKLLDITPEDAFEHNTLSVEEFVKNMNKGNRKSALAWLFTVPFNPVAFKEVKDEIKYADDNFLKAILLSYSNMMVPGVNLEVQLLTNLLSEQDLAVFAGEVFDRWLSAGAEAKKKWILYFSSIHGKSNMVQKLNHNINEWPQKSRGAIACEAVKALALNGTPTALLIVDSISRKFKFKQVKGAAAEALEYAASQLGMTIEELSDKIVPNLGFDETMMRVFDYGDRKFKVFITTALELEVFDDSDKKLKSLPAPGKRDVEEKAKQASEEFKQMKKQLKTTVSTQKMRLELALSSNRSWDCESWKALFVKNPIMHQFAISLIWGAYEEGELKATFRYMEDGTFNTEEEDEYELPATGRIGLVHPIELSEETLNSWKQQLEDYEIKQSLEQLDRKVFKVTEEELEMKYLDRFGGFIINGLSMSGKLTAAGWSRGSILDAGGYYSFYKEDTTLKIGVELVFSGLFIGAENDDTTVFVARFYKSNTVQRGSYIYDSIKQENEYRLADVPNKYFSETVYQLEKALSSSTAKDESWRQQAFPKAKK